MAADTAAAAAPAAAPRQSQMGKGAHILTKGGAAHRRRRTVYDVVVAAAAAWHPAPAARWPRPIPHRGAQGGGKRQPGLRGKAPQRTAQQVGTGLSQPHLKHRDTWLAPTQATLKL